VILFSLSAGLRILLPPCTTHEGSSVRRTLSILNWVIELPSSVYPGEQVRLHARWTLDFPPPCRTPCGPVGNDIRQDVAGNLATFHAEAEHRTSLGQPPDGSPRSGTRRDSRRGAARNGRARECSVSTLYIDIGSAWPSASLGPARGVICFLIYRLRSRHRRIRCSWGIVSTTKTSSGT